MGGKDYVAKYKFIVTPRQAQRLGFDVSNNGISRSGIQTIADLEKYQITDIVNGIEVTRTKFRLRKRRKKKK